jgi:hypothetical protein
MTEDPELRKLYHDLDSKCAGIKSAAKLLRDCPPEERAEMLSLMKEGANALLKCLSDLEKRLGAGKN